MKRVAVAMVLLWAVATLPFLSSSTSAAAAKLPQCMNLVVAATSVQGTQQVGSTSILLVNVGGRCVFEGYPTIQFSEPRFTHLIGHDIHRATVEYASPKPKRVTLGNGMVASIGVSWGNVAPPHQVCSLTRWMNVVLPVGRQLFFETSLVAMPCGSAIWVTPIEAGALPKTP
jgi:uncharacterized protein DUF4232